MKHFVFFFSFLFFHSFSFSQIEANVSYSFEGIEYLKGLGGNIAYTHQLSKKMELSHKLAINTYPIIVVF